MSSQVSPGSEAERKWTKKLRDSFTRKNSSKKTDFADDVSEIASVDVKMPPLDLVQGEKKKKSLRRRLSGSFKKMLTPRSSLSGPMRSDSLARTNSLAYDDDASTKDFMEDEVSLPSSPVQTAEIVRAPSMPLEAGAVGVPEPEPHQAAAEAIRAEVDEAPAPAEEEPAQAEDDLLEPVAEEPAAEEAASDAAPEEVAEEASAPEAAAVSAESPFSAYLAQAAGMMEVATPEEPAAPAAEEAAVVAEEAEGEVSAAAEEPAQASAAAAAAGAMPEGPAVVDEAAVESEVEEAPGVPEEEAAVEAPAVAEEAAEVGLADLAAQPEEQADEEATVEEPAIADEPTVAEEPTVEEVQEEAAPTLCIEESTGSLTYTFQASPASAADAVPDSPADVAAGASAQDHLTPEALAGEQEQEEAVEEEEEEEEGQRALPDEASGSDYSAPPEVAAGSTFLPYPAPKAVLLFPTVSTSSTGILVPDTPQAWDPAEEVSKSASSGGLAGMDSGAASDSGDKSAGEEEVDEPAPAVKVAPVEAEELCPVEEAVTKEVVVMEEAEAEVDAELERLEETPALAIKAPEAPTAAIPTTASKGTQRTRRGRGHGLLRALAKTALLGAAVGAVALATGGLPKPKQAKRAERSRAGAGELAMTAALGPAERDGPLAALSQWWGVYMSQ